MSYFRRVGYGKDDCSTKDIIEDICEMIGDGILGWPRLERQSRDVLGLYTGRSSTAPTEPLVRIHSTACSATRAWIRFVDPPQISSIKIEDILKEWPSWVYSAVGTLGMAIGDILVEDDTYRQKEKYWWLGLESWSRERVDAIINIAGRVPENRVAGPFCHLYYDCQFSVRHGSSSKQRSMKKMHPIMWEFAKWVKCALCVGAKKEVKCVHHIVAEAVLQSSIWRFLREMPYCGRMFSSDHADLDGKSPERDALAKALRKRKMRAVRWSDDCRAEDENTRLRIPSLGPTWYKTGGSYLLLEFADAAA